MRIAISILQPKPPTETKQEYKRPCLKTKVDDYIQAVNSNDKDSFYEWNYLKQLYAKLVNIKPSEQTEGILTKLEDLFEKYANKDHDNAVELDAQTMNKDN